MSDLSYCIRENQTPSLRTKRYIIAHLNTKSKVEDYELLDSYAPWNSLTTLIKDLPSCASINIHQVGHKDHEIVSCVNYYLHGKLFSSSHSEFVDSIHDLTLKSILCWLQAKQCIDNDIKNFLTKDVA